jgi:hypothetical protein
MSLSYAPGPQFLVAIPKLAFHTASEDLARRVWAATDEASDAQDLLVALVRDGLAILEAFVLIDARDDRVRVLVRGPFTVCARGPEGNVEWTGSGVTTWAEKAFDQVDDIRVGEQQAAADRLPLRIGIVRCAGFEFRPTGPGADRSSQLPDDALQPAGPSGPAQSPPLVVSPAVSAPIIVVPSLADLPASEPPAIPVEPPTGEPQAPLAPSLAKKPTTLQVSCAESEPDADHGPEALPVSVVGPSPKVDPAQTRTENVDDGFDHLFESTIVRSVEDAAIRDIPDGVGVARLEAIQVAEPTRLGDHDGHTITIAQLGPLRQQLSSTDATETSPPPGVWLEVSNGDVVPLDRDVVIGRRPEVDRVQGGRVPTVVTVPSPRQDVSRTHLRIGWSGQKVLATDLHSMNGTVLTAADGSTRALDGGVPHQIVEGDVLDIGDGITVILHLTLGDGG